MLKKLFAGIAILAMLLVSSPVVAGGGGGFFYEKEADAVAFAVNLSQGDHVLGVAAVGAFSTTDIFGQSKSLGVALGGGYAENGSVLGGGLAASSASLITGIQFCQNRRIFTNTSATGISLYGYSASGDRALAGGFAVSKSIATKHGAMQFNAAGAVSSSSSSGGGGVTTNNGPT